jgi:hypothetical protein
MTAEQHLVEGARTATGDNSIEVAGLFQPRGMLGRTILGSLAGGGVGDMVGGEVGQLVGTAAGAVAGRRSGAIGAELRYVVAVSPAAVYVLAPVGSEGARREDLSLVHTFDRSRLEVHVKARVNVRILALEDTEDGSRMELEGSRIAVSTHTDDVFHALVLGHDRVGT